MASVWPLKGTLPGLNQGRSKAFLFFLSFWMQLPQKPCSCLSLWKSCGLREKVHTCVSICVCCLILQMRLSFVIATLMNTNISYYFPAESLVVFCLLLCVNSDPWFPLSGDYWTLTGKIYRSPTFLTPQVKTSGEKNPVRHNLNFGKKSISMSHFRLLKDSNNKNLNLNWFYL